jgi:regulator of nucleoside diphosphate kinase
MIMNLPDITLSRRDLGRLDTLLGGTLLDRLGRVGEFLLRELARANVVPDHAVPSTIVAMDSRVRFQDDASGRVTVARLVYPHEVSLDEPCVSVLTPVGAALLGLSEGDSIAYETPDGRLKTLTLLEVLDPGPRGGGVRTEADTLAPAGAARADAR